MKVEKKRRSSAVERTTRETSLRAEVCLDGRGKSDLDTGVPFLDHMLELLARHGRFDIACRGSGDVRVDAHHTTEDAGIVLGQAFGRALGKKEGIRRFGEARVPMQESLAVVAVDISGRALLHYNVRFPTAKVGEFDVELVGEFFQAFCSNAAITMHVDLVRGQNSHHIAEAIFKAAARALRAAVAMDPEAAGEVPSTKGTL